MSKLNWIEKAFSCFKPKKSLARSVIVTVVAVALVLGVGLVPIAPLTETAQAQEGNEDGQTLNVAEWSGPAELEDVSGRPTVLYDDEMYHMWYSPSNDEIYHTSSKDPDSFEAATNACTFTDGDPKEVGSVTVVEEGGIFYMIAYGPEDDGDKVFNIYTSTDGDTWANAGLVFDGAAAFGTLPGFQKIDGPYLFKDGTTYRLYFQVKTQVDDVNYYNIYTAKSTAASLAEIADTDDTVDFTLANENKPVLSPGEATDWDSRCVMHPWVVEDDGTYYMWYSGHKGSNQQIGFAYSSDGYEWTKSRGNPILPRDGVYNALGEPSVIKDGATLRMWYLPTSDRIRYLEATGPFEFSSIQAAVNAASAGDIIKVAPGTYTEQVVINNTSLTLEGAGAGSTIIVAPESRTSFTFSESGSSWEPVVFAFGRTNNNGTISGTDTITVTISGFTIDGDDRVPTTNYRSAGILLRNAEGVISNNTVQNMSIDGKETFGIAAYGDSDVVISGNNVSGYARVGIVANGDNSTNPDPNAIITGNTVTGPGMDEVVTWAPNGIQIGYGATGKIIGNTVRDNGYPGSDWSGSGILVTKSDGVEVYDNTVTGNEIGIGSDGVINGTWIHDNMVDGNTFGISIQNEAVNTTIENNIITNNSYDGIDICNFEKVDGGPPTETTIRGNTITTNNTKNGVNSGGIWVAEGVDGDEVSINFNNIVGNNGFGVINDSETGTIDATNNWWGDASGPYHATLNTGGAGDAVSDNVLFDPWLLSDTLPPQVVSTDPANGATGVAVDKTITVTFDDVIIQQGDNFDNIAVKAGGTTVATTSAVSNYTLTITPEGRWAYSTTYNVTIPAGAVKNEAGAPLQDTYTFSFTTRSKPSGGAPAPEPTPTPPSAVEPVSDSVVNNAIEEAEETGQVTIEVNKEETALTIEQLEQIADTDKPAVIKTEEVEFVLPPEVVADLAETDAVQIEITAEKVAANEAPTPPSGFQLAGEVFELTIVTVDEEGNKDEISGFSKAITITLPVPASAKDAAVAGKLDVYRYNETTKTWEAMGGIYDEATNTISFSTTHLSKYALLERTALPTKTFADIKGHWAQSDIEIMAGLGIVGGISENEFAPQMPVNRAQFAAFLIRSLGIQETSPAESHFKDVPTNAWYYGAVEGAYAAGLVGGYEDGTFRPEKEISRQEIAALIARALKNEGEEVTVDDVDLVLARFKDASKISSWAKEEAAQAVASGIIGGRDGLFAPKDSTKRAEAVVMLKRMLVKLGVI